MFSIRFHLQRGLYYKHWQIKDMKHKDVAVEYIDPQRYQLYLEDCELFCNENKARKVYAAGVKDVCGWIQCRDLYVCDPDLHHLPDTSDLPMLKFNPIIDPNWRIEGMFGNFNGKRFDSIITSGNRCYVDELCCAT